LEGGVAETVIGRSLLRILQDVIGLIQGLEVRFLVGAAAMTIGMAVHGQLAIGRLDRLIVSAPLDAEQFVIIRGHHSPPMTNGAD